MRLALEAAAGLVRVDDHVGGAAAAAPGRWWSVTSTCRPSALARGHAVDAGDAVVHRDQQVGAAAPSRAARSAASGRSRRPRGRAPGSSTCCAPSRRRPRTRDGAGGGAVAVVVGHDADALVGARWRRPAARRLRARPSCAAGGSRRARPSSSSSLPQHAARGVQARQQRMHAGLLQRPGGARRNVAGDDLHRASSTAGACAAAEQAADASAPGRAAAAPKRCARALAAQRERARRLAARRSAASSAAHGAGVELLPGRRPRPAPVVAQRRRRAGASATLRSRRPLRRARPAARRCR